MHLRTFGWFNVQLRVNCPSKHVKIKEVSYFFHPAFSMSVIRLKRPPFDLVVKLCSDVPVVISIRYKYRGVEGQFNLIHKMLKEPSIRTYLSGDYGYSGDEKQKRIDKPETYFDNLLELYQRPADYYSRAFAEQQSLSWRKRLKSYFVRS
ncbi:hypothetical protein GEMRC1_011577 [Eukaryota sp. GEM-RC1]